MECFLKVVLHVLSEIAAPCIKAFREGGKKVRGLEARAEATKKECLEWKERYLAAESRIQTLVQKLATAYAAIGVLAGTVMLGMIFPQARVLIGLVGLSIVFGGQLLPMANKLGSYASKVSQYANNIIRQIPQTLHRCITQLRSRMPDWKWKSVPIFRSVGMSQ